MNDQLKNTLEEELEKAKQKSYQSLVKETAPTTPYVKNTFFAFLVGGAICGFGQIILEIFLFYGLERETSVTITLLVIIFLGAFCTGLGIYDKIGKYGGAGSIVPISGFANSMVAPALEWKSEGYINGLGAKLFTIAGPVIVYGIGGSVFLGFIKYLWLALRGIL